jgi:hypothetical protein
MLCGACHCLCAERGQHEQAVERVAWIAWPATVSLDVHEPWRGGVLLDNHL